MRVLELPREYFLRRQIRARLYGKPKLPVPNDRPSIWSSRITMTAALTCGALVVGVIVASLLW